MLMIQMVMATVRRILTNNWADVELWVMSELLHSLGEIRVSFKTSGNHCPDS